MSIQPWKRIEQPVVIDGSFFSRYGGLFRSIFGGMIPGTFGKSMIIQKYLRPDGKNDVFTLLREKDASKIFALTEDQKVIAVRQYKQGCDGGVLELPGGSANFGEHPEQTIRRELEEETGYRASGVVALGAPQYMSTRNSSAKTYLFAGYGCVKIGEQKLDKEEIEIDVELFSLGQWVEVCGTEIVDPYSVAATFRALRIMAILLRPAILEFEWLR